MGTQVKNLPWCIPISHIFQLMDKLFDKILPFISSTIFWVHAGIQAGYLQRGLSPTHIFFSHIKAVDQNPVSSTFYVLYHILISISSFKNTGSAIESKFRVREFKFEALQLLTYFNFFIDRCLKLFAVCILPYLLQYNFRLIALKCRFRKDRFVSVLTGGKRVLLSWINVLRYNSVQAIKNVITWF